VIITKSHGPLSPGHGRCVEVRIRRQAS
jgi:hypothetical protein